MRDTHCPSLAATDRTPYLGDIGDVGLAVVAGDQPLVTDVSGLVKLVSVVAGRPEVERVLGSQRIRIHHLNHLMLITLIMLIILIIM